MKVFVGILSVLITLTVGTLAVLAIWGIYPVSWVIIWKAGLSLIIAAVVLLVTWLIVLLFLRKEKHTGDGNKGHRIN